MKEDQFRNYLKKYKLTADETNLAVNSVKEFENYLEHKKIPLKTAGVDTLREYISLLIEEDRNSMNRLVAIARYCKITKKDDFYIYLVSTFGARNVLPDIGKRIDYISGDSIQQKIFEGLELPPLGSPHESYPILTKIIMDRLIAAFPNETCRKILTWNYHKVPIESFKEKKDRYEKSDSIDVYLKNEHKRFVEELRRFMNEGRIWYEQEITPEVLEFVQGNQEICTGIRRGNRIYLTKIPYAPKQYLEEKNSSLKKYYACHCPLVRSTLSDGKIEISHMFCYCSAGYEKIGFDVIFEESVEVELLESALKGDSRCRFVIKIPEGKMK